MSKKTKSMVVTKHPQVRRINITIEGKPLEQVERVIYSGEVGIWQQKMGKVNQRLNRELK